MTVRHLKTFIAVCEAGGITKAASALYVAQPAVSQTISEIEKYYNVILFDRIGNRNEYRFTHRCISHYRQAVRSANGCGNPEGIAADSLIHYNPADIGDRGIAHERKS